MENGVSVDPEWSFKVGPDWYHFIKDDGCVVMVVPGTDGQYTWASHWFPRAQQEFINYWATRDD